MMETRQILETSDLDGFEKRRLSSPGLQVEVVILDHDARKEVASMSDVAEAGPSPRLAMVSGAKSLDVVGSVDPKLWLGATPDVMKSTRIASEFLFSVLGAHTQSELAKLLTENFDCEQIWQQIDLQATLTLGEISRSLRKLEKSGQLELVRLGEKKNTRSTKENKKAVDDFEEGGSGDLEAGGLSAEGLSGLADEDEDDDFDNEEEVEEGSKSAEEYSDYDEEEKRAVEDKFLKLTDMEKFLDWADAEDAGVAEDDDDEEEDEEEALGEDDEEDDEEDDGEYFQGEKLSAHERQLVKTKRRIEQLEKANLESKDWTMQGEVSASRRSKNSALEVELDFEHGARPAAVITEEVTQLLEDIIRSRIIEGNFDDPRPRAASVTCPPKERIEMDEEKSKKGLGELYEQEYMESAGLAVAATPAMETLKAEATILFKNLCNKLDALSHFHFAPKPVVEEMEVKVDVPALAMEEVAPLAVSDASMLAPEEVYKSAGLVKGESELSPEERKRRRAHKKRKRKGAKDAAENVKKLRTNSGPVKDPLKELNVRSTRSTDKRTTSSFSKSAKVFAELDNAQERGNKAAKPDNADKPTINASSLKL